MTLRSALTWLAVGFMTIAAVAAVAADPTIDVAVDLSEIEFMAEGRLVTPIIDGYRSLAEEGAPSIPARVVHFVIPADMNVADVIVSYTDEETLPGTYRIAPMQPELPIGEERAPVDASKEIYESDAVYPQERAVYLGDGYLGGYHIVTVALHPLRYHPESGRLVISNGLEARLELAPSADRSAPRYRMTADAAETYRRVVSGMVENPEDIAACAKQGVDVVSGNSPGGFVPRYSPSLEGSLVEYVIITNEEYESYFQQIADWKTKKGIPAVVRTVSWINANYSGGADTAERIRLFIRDAFASWGTTYVLLGGDTGVIPPRYAVSAYYGGWEISTDLYYSDLDGNWNGDGDSVFGEGYSGPSAVGDSLDLYPDVFVGRAPVATIIEAETFVNKTFEYITSPNPVFAERNLYLAEVLFPYDWEDGMLISTDGAEDVVEPVLSLVPPNIHNALLYQNYDPFPQSWPLNRVAAIDSMDLGYNIVSHVGHGNKDIMRCSRLNYVTLQDVDALVNGQTKAGYFWMLNCTSTAIEYDCIAEHLMNNPNGGASSLFGPTRFCFPTTAKDYYYSWFDYLYVQGTQRAGVVSAACKTPYVAESGYDNTDRWTQMSHTYLGDPEMRLWTARPKNLTVVHASTKPLGDVSLSVSVSNPAAVDSALVCVMKGTEVYARGYTNASGQLVLSFTPETTGQMTITVTAANHLPYEDTIAITSTAGAHVSFGSVTIDDDALGLSDGNANGVAEAGETIQLSMLVRNAGQSAATGVTATLVSVDPLLSLVDDTEYLGDLNATSQAQFDSIFAVQLSNDCVDEYETVLEVQFEDTVTRTTWTDDYTLRVLRPLPRMQFTESTDDGNGDGIPHPGETVTFTVQLLNEGNGDADVLTGVLRYPNAEVTLVDSTETWGDISAGAAADGTDGFQFSVVSTATQHLRLALADEDGKEWTILFDLVPPDQPLNLDGNVRSTTIFLTWDPVAQEDLWGYNVYRAEALTGPYGQVNAGVVELISYYEDAGLEENQRYFYRVAAIDSSANEGDHSTALEISTNPPSQSGWPLMGGELIYNTPVIWDIDLDGDLELLVGSGHIHCWHDDGVEYRDGDGDPRTSGVYEVDGVGGYRASIAVGELDGDAYPEIVAAAWGNVGSGTDEYEIYAWNAEDASVLPGWPVTTSKFCWATPALGDLDHDGLDEIVIPCANGNLYVWKGDGTELIDGDANPLTDGVFTYLGDSWAYASACLADLDDDHELEIIVPSRSDSIYVFNPDGTRVPGWPVGLRDNVLSSPCVADLDGDGDLEVIATSAIDSLWVFDHNGLKTTGWPKFVDMGGDFPPSPTVADITGNGQMEIIQVDINGQISVYTWYGTLISGWPQFMDSGCHSSPAVGNIDRDSGWEIVIGSNNGKVYAFDSDGDVLPGWPIQTDAEVYCTPTLTDFDQDGDIEVVVSSFDAMVYVWDVEGEYDDGDGVQWETFRCNFHRNGLVGYEEPVGVAEDAPVNVTLATLEQNFPNPFNPTTTIAFSVRSAGARIELGVYNIAGELVRTLTDGDVPGGQHTIIWNGRDDGGRQVSSGVYFVRLECDGQAETRKIALLK